MQIGREKRGIEPAAVPLVPALPLSLPLMASPSVQSAGIADHLPSLMGPLVMSRALPSPNILVFDSGLGGLTVFREIAKARPDAQFVYAADDAVFPYGKIEESTLIARVLEVMGGLIEAHQPDLVVVACNTASTIVLPALRQHFDLPFVGTVPAIKPACAASKSKRVTVLGTEATVKREYTRALIRQYGAGCDVDLVGSARLAAFAEAEIAGVPVADADIATELAPCFVGADGRRTDTIVLACTHYPLLMARFEKLAPWPVRFLDPAPAIARRVVNLLGPATGSPDEGSLTAIFTSGREAPAQLAAAMPGLVAMAAD
jgi:glutamate racemase